MKMREKVAVGAFAALCGIIAVICFIVDALAIPTFIVFLILKLIGVIAWSWFFVCLPLIVLAVATVIYVLLYVWLNWGS